jgi:PAS domain S-box-containing protein
MRSTPPELARSVLEAAPDAMLIIDVDGIIRFINRQITAVFGYQHDEVVGKSIVQLIPERFHVQHVTHRTRFMGDVRLRPMGAGLDLYARRQDGSEFPVEISLSPIDDGGRRLVAAAIRDVTDRNRVRAELILARETAERARVAADEAREVADQARELADRANQGKSRFLTAASHDLRQPLQVLALLNGMLRRSVTEPEAAEALAQQELSIGAMSRLLNTLLDMGKLESGAIHPEFTEFSVAALFEELRSEFAGLASSKGLEFRVEPAPVCVHSDIALVEQILRNLVSNAIKYTPSGRVILHCREEKSFVRIEVQDSGIGIAPDQLPHIYDEFYQVGVSANSTRDGYGLGLSIVQRLVKLLDIGLEVRSELGAGSSFAILLPTSSKQVAGKQTEQLSAHNDIMQEDHPHILLVEDDQGVRNATRMLLSTEGYQVSPVATLVEALAVARGSKRIDLLVTDYHLGNGETGTQVIAALRQVQGVPIKAVLTTGDTSSAVRELPLDAGLRLASKPIKAEQLLALIRGLLLE